jgi:hypothetical protein
MRRLRGRVPTGFAAVSTQLASARTLSHILIARECSSSTPDIQHLKIRDLLLHVGWVRGFDIVALAAWDRSCKEILEENGIKTLHDLQAADGKALRSLGLSVGLRKQLEIWKAGKDLEIFQPLSLRLSGDKEETLTLS